MSAELESAIDKLKRYGQARNRQVDQEPREVCITDDEALAILAALDSEFRTYLT